MQKLSVEMWSIYKLQFIRVCLCSVNKLPKMRRRKIEKWSQIFRNFLICAYWKMDWICAVCPDNSFQNVNYFLCKHFLCKHAIVVQTYFRCFMGYVRQNTWCKKYAPPFVLFIPIYLSNIFDLSLVQWENELIVHQLFKI